MVTETLHYNQKIDSRILVNFLRFHITTIRLGVWSNELTEKYMTIFRFLIKFLILMIIVKWCVPDGFPLEDTRT